MKKSINAALAAVFTLALATNARAAGNTSSADVSQISSTQVIKAGGLEISMPMIRATPPKAPVSAGYMKISNPSETADRLIGGSAEFAGKVEIHEMTMDGNIMKMRPVEGGLEIPSGSEVFLKPAGYHIMLMQLKEQMQEGQTRKLTLEFEQAGSIELELPVMPVGAGKHMGQKKHLGQKNHMGQQTN